ncbi:MAG: glycosyltransferase, partial [Elusimicrobiota bacterium]
VNVIGAGGDRVRAGYIAGAGGNAALMGITRALGAVSIDQGVRVVGVNPGAVETDRLVEMARVNAQARFGDAGRWRIVPSGTSLDESNERGDKAALRGKLGLERDAVWAGSLLRLEHVKGPDVFLEAAGRLKDNTRLRFVAIGDGSMREALRRRIAQLGLQKSFLLAGHQEDIWSWLGALDIYVQPSRNEGMGRALIQAQSLGLPAAASRVCGIPDVAKEGEGGLLVPPGDPAALANAIRALADDPARREDLGQRGRKWVRENDELGLRRFSHETMAERLRLLYHDILKGQAKRS